MNNYGNAEPKILKTLNSSGQVLNDSGEVISDTSDYWEKVYNEAEPKPDKILHSDGTIKDSAGNLIQDTTEFNVKKYTQAEPIPAKYLHSDGTIDENPGSGSGGKVTAYAWHVIVEGEDVDLYFDFDVVPQTLEELLTHFAINNESSIIEVNKIDSVIGDEGFTRISDTKFSMTDGSDVFVIERSSSSYDFTLWEAD